ncbi:DUF262 domain-containing protein [Pedobacter psychrodurus]|uniref:DUF262 domain-containing protein n=1 Tax=Pedobacter psychrodurus TaxID=2530456 RepID=A0A4R0Q855_9SPHI|nr:DUF262 domain-containing protein [Pedobacter psychrodurus]TCD29626.1 DUF262 domain-containing protein [Pedobacter psychrodurus]
MDTIKSELIDLKKIIERDLRFNVPRYQRLYVWEEEQVKTLFTDIYTAYKAKKEAYYIGGIIIVRNKSLDIYDLVDGQQRFTTIWLMANHLGGALKAFVKSKGELRLKFSIRKNVEQYFNFLSNEELDSNTEAFDDLVRISKGRKTIENFIDSNLNDFHDKTAFVDYILKNVKMVYTQVPESMDLNKLFETLNNRGIQLSQHEILKAKLLSFLPNKQERHRYAIIWNACSDMTNYLERSFAYEIGNSRDIADSYNKWSYRHDWKYLVDTLKHKRVAENKILNLSDILAKDFEPFNNNADGQPNEDFFHPKTSDDEFEKVRSILSFPQLLLHTLRIYLFEKKSPDLNRINEKELLLTFSNYLYKDLNEKESRKFIDVLLRVREVFDKYIIKWVEEEKNEEIHQIKILSKENKIKRGKRFYLRRKKSNETNGLALLQSMLYHSQQNTTQYWLTPFLYRLLKQPTLEDAYQQLKYLDNAMFSNSSIEDDLIIRSLKCMDTIPDFVADLKILRTKKGTGFPHYWFYKLEFVLWHERSIFPKNKLWDDYKLTARNSIEHIAPQHPRDIRDKVCDESLDAFGNLVLVSRGINSEYSDWSYPVKRSKFQNKKDKGDRNCLESLKSDLIYSEHEIWNDVQAELHQDQMIRILGNYFEKTKIQADR